MKRKLVVRAPQLLAILATALAATDGVLKYWALTHLSDQVPQRLLGSFFGLLLHRNYGVVANIPLPHWFVIPLSAVIVAGCLRWLYVSLPDRDPRNLTWQGAGIVSLVVGALGNMLDRIVNGFTTDYLLFFNRSVINIADVLIILGLIALLITPKPSPNKNLP